MKTFKLMLALGLLASLCACHPQEKIDPDNKATARSNGKKWKALVKVTETDGDFWGLGLYSMDKYGVLREQIIFYKVPQRTGTYLLNGFSLQEKDTASVAWYSYVGDGCFAGPRYSVLTDGNPNNWIRVESYNAKTRELVASFQATYVKYDITNDTVSRFADDSVVFTDGEIHAIVE
jgi:hypothetical protein